MTWLFACGGTQFFLWNTRSARDVPTRVWSDEPLHGRAHVCCLIRYIYHKKAGPGAGAGGRSETQESCALSAFRGGRRCSGHRTRVGAFGSMSPSQITTCCRPSSSSLGPSNLTGHRPSTRRQVSRCASTRPGRARYSVPHRRGCREPLDMLRLRVD